MRRVDEIRAEIVGRIEQATADQRRADADRAARRRERMNDFLSRTAGRLTYKALIT